MNIEVGKVYQFRNTPCAVCAPHMHADASALNGYLFTPKRIVPMHDPCLRGEWRTTANVGTPKTQKEPARLPGSKVGLPGCCLHPLDDLDEMTEEEVKQCEPVLL